MTWGAGFLADLDDEKHRISLRLVLCPETTPTLYHPGPATEIVLTNYDEGGAYNCLRAPCRVSGASVDPWTWRYTMGQLEIGFSAMRVVSGVEIKDQILRDILDAKVARGSVVELWVGFDTTDSADMERVFLGTLFDIQSERGMGARTAFRLIARDAVSLVQSVSNSISTAGALFINTFEVEETLSIAYTVGDATLSMADVSNFERETGGTGAVLLDTGGDPFLLTYTGTSGGTQLTGVSAAGQFYTTASNGAGTVANVVLMQGHPVDILRRMFVSTGDGTNGTWDDYPASWGLALPESFVDVADMGDWKTATDSTEVWNVIAEEVVTNPLQWIEGIWGRAGIFPVHAQGMLTVRAAQDIQGTPTETTGITITDSQIAAVEAWSAFDPSQPWEYTDVETVTGGDPRLLTQQELFLETGSVVYSFETILAGAATLAGVSAEAANTRPSQELRQIDLSRCLWGPGYADGNETTRMAPWYLDTREPLTLLGRGLAWARFAPGDVVNVTTSLAFGYVESSGAGTYSSAQMMVVAGPDVDWLGGTCRMRLVRLPGRVIGA